MEFRFWGASETLPWEVCRARKLRGFWYHNAATVGGLNGYTFQAIWYSLGLVDRAGGGIADLVNCGLYW